MLKKIKKFLSFGKCETVGIKSRKVSEQNEFSVAAEKSKVLAIFLLMLLWLTATVMLSLPKDMPTDYELIEKQKAPRYIFAKFDYSYIDPVATEKAKLLAMQQEPFFYEIDSDKSAAMRQEFTKLLEILNVRNNLELEGKKYTPADDNISQIVANLSKDDFVTLNFFNTSRPTLLDFEREIDSLIGAGVISLEEQSSKKLGDKIKIIDLAGRERSVKTMNEIVDSTQFAAILARKISDQESIKKALEKLYANSYNLNYNPELTQKRKKEVAEEVANVMIEVSKNEPIVAKGEIVTSDIRHKLATYAEEEKIRNDIGTNYESIIQHAIFSFILVLFIGFYMYHIHPDIMNSNFKLLLLGSITIIAMVVNYLAMELYFLVSQTYNLNPKLIINFIPIALASATLVAMLGFRVAIYVGFWLSSIMAVMTGNSFEFAFIGIVLSSVSALMIRGATNHRSFFIRTFVAVTLCNWIFNVNVPQYFDDVTLIYQSGFVALFCGLMTAILAQTIVYFYEIVFNVTTNMSLMVLCDYGHPLLERLKREASGTFYHSMMVATLAEDAAIAIKANPLKAKCGALFHDIGKLEKPEYFTENNIDSENKHIHLSPQNSFVCIRNHVKDGLALAKKYKLNQVIKNAIVQHHGNDLSYFYYQAHKISGKEDIPEAQFRYHGTPPKSKEMVIISLADACEAAVCSIEKPTPSKIEAMVDEIFRKRFRDNQLIYADVTCGELRKIRDSFITNLVSMRHGRIAYKKENENNEGDLFMESELQARAEHNHSTSKNIKEIH